MLLTVGELVVVVGVCVLCSCEAFWLQRKNKKKNNFNVSNVHTKINEFQELCSVLIGQSFCLYTGYSYPLQKSVVMIGLQFVQAPYGGLALKAWTIFSGYIEIRGLTVIFFMYVLLMCMWNLCMWVGDNCCITYFMIFLRQADENAEKWTLLLKRYRYLLGK